MSNYVIKLSSGRSCDMCVYVCEKKRERERERKRETVTLMNNNTNGG